MSEYWRENESEGGRRDRGKRNNISREQAGRSIQMYDHIARDAFGDTGRKRNGNSQTWYMCVCVCVFLAGEAYKMSAHT